jgi:hypothetical protein
LRSAYPEEQPSRLSNAGREGMSGVWTEIEALQIEVREEIEERRRGLRSAYYSGEAPLGGGV